MRNKHLKYYLNIPYLKSPEDALAFLLLLGHVGLTGVVVGVVEVRVGPDMDSRKYWSVDWIRNGETRELVNLMACSFKSE